MKLDKFDINKFIDKTPLSGSENPYLQNNINESLYKQIKSLLDKFSLTSQHVLKNFPLECFDEDEISRVLEYMLNLKHKVNREIISQMNKISVDIDLDEFDPANMDSGNESLKTYFEYIINESRKIIRKNTNVFSRLFEINKNILEELMNSSINYYNMYRYVMFSENIILQSIIYLIIYNNNLDKNKKKECFLKIQENINLLDSELSKSILERRKVIEIDVDNALKIFIKYLKLRNYFGEYIKIQNMLETEEKEEPELFAKVKKQYKVTKYSNIEKEHVKDIVTEGMNVYDFENKLIEVKEIIEVFKYYGGRNVDPNNVLDLKVYFREIFISKSKYKLQAKRLIRKYLDTLKETGKIDFDKDSEYMFFREKITRGYYRENDNLEWYNEKNRIQMQLYGLLENVFLLYDYNNSIEAIYNINYDLLRILEYYLK